MPKKFIVNTDGGARGNPGPAGAGWVIFDGERKKISSGSKYLGEITNNAAEYEAVILALEALKKFIPKDKRSEAEIEFRLDSELVVRQLNGEYQVKTESLWPKFMAIHNLQVADFSCVNFIHVPRDKNKAADELANEAMDGHSDGLV